MKPCPLLILYLQIFLLVHLLCLSLLGTSVLCLTLPVFLGRFFMSLWVGNGVVVHELYTAACGLYLCWLMCRLATMIWSWLPAGIDLILEKAKMYTILVSLCILCHCCYFNIITLTNVLPFHWLRALHMIWLSFARRRPCDSASVCRALVRRLLHGVQYPDVRCVYEDDKLIVCNHFGLHDTTCSTVKVFAVCIRIVRGL